MQEFEWENQISNVQDLETKGYTEFTTLIDTERHLSNEVAEQIAKLPYIGSVKAVVGFGSPETYTLVATGFLKSPVVDEVSEYMTRLAQIRGVLKEPNGSVRCSTFLAGKIYKWNTPKQ